MNIQDMIEYLETRGFKVTVARTKTGHMFKISKYDYHAVSIFEDGFGGEIAQQQFLDRLLSTWNRGYLRHHENVEIGEALHAGFTLGMNRAYEKRVTDTWIGDMWPPITSKQMLNSVYGKNPDPNIQLKLYAALMKGENNMPNDINTLAEAFRNLERAFNRKLPGIKTVHFSGPVTAVIWEDGTKTLVRCKDGEVPDYEKGLAMAIAKKALGTNKSGSNYYDIFKKWLPKAEEEEEE